MADSRSCDSGGAPPRMSGNASTLAANGRASRTRDIAWSAVTSASFRGANLFVIEADTQIVGRLFSAFEQANFSVTRHRILHPNEPVFVRSRDDVETNARDDCMSDEDLQLEKPRLPRASSSRGGRAQAVYLVAVALATIAWFWFIGWCALQLV